MPTRTLDTAISHFLGVILLMELTLESILDSSKLTMVA